MSRPRRWPSLLARLALPVLFAASAAAQQPGAGRRGAAAITPADLKRDLYGLADDHFRGREAGTLDELKASTWLAEQARKIGLEPAGDDGTYLQWWPLRRNRLAATSMFTVGGAPVAMWKDAAITVPTDARVEGPVVVVEATDSAAIAALDLRGKVAVQRLVAPPEPPPAGISLREWRYLRLAELHQGALLRAAGAAAVILLADATAESAWDFHTSWTSRGTYALDSAGVVQRPRAVAPVILVRGRLADVLRAGTPVAIDFRTESFVYPSVNVVARARGTNPRSGEVVLFSGHQDHDGVRHAIEGDSIWNGADDNGSVSVGLLGIARAWKREPGRRGALFVWHGAEERGLLGSNWYVDHPTVPRDSIIAVINADMIGRGPADSAALLGRFPPHRNSTALIALALEANRRTGRFALDTLWDKPEHPEFWYFRSDHVPYARRGIPVAYFTSLPHPDYHTPRDEPSRIEYDKLARIARWMYVTGLLAADAKARVGTDPGVTLER